MSTVFVSIIIVYNLLLVYVLLREGRKVRSTVYFWLVILAATLWAGTILITDLLTIYSQIVLWSRLSFATSALVVLMLYYFSRYFPEEQSGSRPMAVAAIVLSGLFVVLSLSNNIVAGYGPDGTVFGWGQPAFLGFMLLGFSVSLFQMYRTYHRLRHTLQGFQILYVLLGLSISIGLAVGTNLVLPLLHIAEIRFLGPLAMVVFLTLTTYVIVKHRLMDIRLVLRKSIIYVGLSVFVFAAYYATVAIDQQFFGGPYTDGALLSALIITPLFLVGFALIGRFLRHIANKYFFTGLYDPQQTIKEFASTISQTLKLDEVGTVIGDTIQNTFRTDAVALVLLKHTSERIHVVVVNERGFEKDSLSGTEIPAVLEGREGTRRQPLVVEEVIAVEADSGALRRTCATLKGKGVEVMIPLSMKEKINAAIVVGRKATKEAYTKEDIDLLGTLSDQAAIAVENARLYNSMQEIVEEQTHEIKQKNVRLQELLKMKSEFLSIASHQLRTPLTAIRGLLAMQAEGDLDKLSKAEQKKEQQHMLESANRLSNIVNDLLDAMELEGGHLNFKFQKTDLATMISEIADELKPNYDKKGITFILNAQERVPTVEAESKMLREALENVIDNAEKYTNKGRVTVMLSSDDKRVTITVRDTGIGIPKSDKARLFEKFSRGEKSSYQHTDGSGLGLFIAKNVVSEHHGDITLQSAGEGKGTTVTITLPIVQPHNSKR